MRSTQMYESMNAYLNRFLKICLRLYGFVQHFDRAITRIRHNEAKVEFKSNHSSPVFSSKLTILEKHATSVFTRESFFKFREEMKNAKLFFVTWIINNDTFRSYTLSKLRHSCSKWEVQFWSQLVALKCSCMMFKSNDIPCAHMVVMKVEHMEEIHTSYILNR